MTTEQYNEIVRAFREKIDAETTAKNTDYARPEDGDFLDNFYETAERMGVTPLQAWGVHWTKHIIAIEKFIRTGSLASEKIEGRILDASNYLNLLLALIQEEGVETQASLASLPRQIELPLAEEPRNTVLDAVKNFFHVTH